MMEFYPHISRKVKKWTERADAGRSGIEDVIRSYLINSHHVTDCSPANMLIVHHQNIPDNHNEAPFNFVG